MYNNCPVFQLKCNCSSIRSSPNFFNIKYKISYFSLF